MFCKQSCVDNFSFELLVNSFLVIFLELNMIDLPEGFIGRTEK